MCKHKLGIASMILGVLLLALSAYQVNQYMSAVSIASNAKALAESQIDAAAAGLGLTADQIAEYKTQMQDQIAASTKTYALMADSLVPPILLDAILGLVFVGAGVMLAGKECCEAEHRSRK
ncbi:MAG: hypothetical protein WC792_03920 [Candidatus Micrarchaeia archaeon]|jgi:hypothetical protein